MYHLYFLFINFEVLCAKNLNFSKKIAHLNFAVKMNLKHAPPHIPLLVAPLSYTGLPTKDEKSKTTVRNLTNQFNFKTLKCNLQNFKEFWVVLKVSSFVGNPVYLQSTTTHDTNITLIT